MITTILFEIPGVFIRRSRMGLESVALRREIAVNDLLRALYAGGMWENYRRGIVEEERYWSAVEWELFRFTGRAVGMAALRDEVETAIRPDRRLMDVLQELRAKHRLVAVTGAEPEHFTGRTGGRGLLKQFDEVIHAVYGVDPTVPDILAYARIPLLLGVEPQKVLFVDDRAQHLEVASRLGMRIHAYEDENGIRQALGCPSGQGVALTVGAGGAL